MLEVWGGEDMEFVGRENLWNACRSANDFFTLRVPCEWVRVMVYPWTSPIEKRERKSEKPFPHKKRNSYSQNRLE
jgi:hypothetical protein